MYYTRIHSKAVKQWSEQTKKVVFNFFDQAWHFLWPHAECGLLFCCLFLWLSLNPLLFSETSYLAQALQKCSRAIWVPTLSSLGTNRLSRENLRCLVWDCIKNKYGDGEEPSPGIQAACGVQGGWGGAEACFWTHRVLCGENRTVLSPKLTLLRHLVAGPPRPCRAGPDLLPARAGLHDR